MGLHPAEYWSRFTALDGRRRLLLCEALLWLVIARISLKLFDFQRMARMLGQPQPAMSAPRTVVLSSDRERAAKDVSRAVKTAARHIPFGAACLPQAIAARTMLRRRGIASIMHFGVNRASGNTLGAHAWLVAGGIEVTGFPLSAGLVEIARFV